MSNVRVDVHSVRADHIFGSRVLVFTEEAGETFFYEFELLGNNKLELSIRLDIGHEDRDVDNIIPSRVVHALEDHDYQLVQDSCKK